MDREIDPGLAAFLEVPAMIVLGTRGTTGRAEVGRGVGLRLAAGGPALDVLASRWQWPAATAHLAPGDPVAVTVSSPADYRTFQIKGRLVEAADADAGDRAFAERYLAAIRNTLLGLGVPPRQVACWLTVHDLVRLRIAPTAVFSQTPGSGAGEARPPGAEAGP